MYVCKLLGLQKPVTTMVLTISRLSIVKVPGIGKVADETDTEKDLRKTKDPTYILGTVLIEKQP